MSLGNKPKAEIWDALLSATPTVLLVLDAKGRVVESKGGGLEALIKQIAARSFDASALELFRDVPWMVQAINRSLAGETVSTSGEVFGIFYDVFYTPLKDADGTQTGVVVLAIDVTRRQEALAALRKSEGHRRLLMSQLPGVLWTTDRDLRITHSDGAGLARLGLKPGQQEGLLLSEAIGEGEDHQATLEGHLRALKGERLVMRAPHRGRHYETVLEPLLDAEGSNIVGVVGVTLDVTERVNTQRELERSLSLLKATLESTADGILVVDRNARVSMFNNQFAKLWRLPADVLNSGDDDQLLAFVTKQFRDPAAFLSKVREVYSHPDTEIFDTIEFADGRIFERFSKPQKLGDQIVGRVWSFRDVTQRRRTEEALKNSQQQLVAIMDGSAAVIYVKDLDGRFLMVNKRFEQNFNVSRDRLAGKTDYDLVPEHQADIIRSHDLKVLKEMRQLEWEEEAQQEDGTHTYISLKFPLRDETGSVYALCGVSTDITERRRMEQARREVELLKDEFMKGAAHELKTPVAVMKANAQLALMRAQELTPSLRKVLEGMVRGADRIDDIIRNLLDVSSLQAGQLKVSKERIDLRELLEDVVRGIRDASKRVHLNADHPVRVDGDRERLGQALSALVDNALRYSPGGEAVDLTLSDRAGQAEISVVDHGIGIPAQKQKKIFERFYRAHSGTPYDYGGMGVGLFIAREIVTQHSGKLWFKSKEGEGSRFAISLPLADVRAFNSESGTVPLRS